MSVTSLAYKHPRAAFSRYTAQLMGHYELRHLFLGPSLVSLLRIPLAGLFVLVVDRPWLALLVLVAAGGSDLIDGAWARRTGQATATGAVVDGVTDKLFVGVVVFTLLWQGHVGWLGALALGARDGVELPLVVWWGTQRHRRRARAEDPRANGAGKLATVFQFATVVALLYRVPGAHSLLIVTALAGTLAGALYWRRELSIQPPS